MADQRTALQQAIANLFYEAGKESFNTQGPPSADFFASEVMDMLAPLLDVYDKAEAWAALTAAEEAVDGSSWLLAVDDAEDALRGALEAARGGSGE